MADKVYFAVGVGPRGEKIEDIVNLEWRLRVVGADSG